MGTLCVPARHNQCHAAGASRRSDATYCHHFCNRLLSLRLSDWTSEKRNDSWMWRYRRWFVTTERDGDVRRASWCDVAEQSPTSLATAAAAAAAAASVIRSTAQRRTSSVSPASRTCRFHLATSWRLPTHYECSTDTGIVAAGGRCT